jgi:hypothetical protein
VFRYRQGYGIFFEDEDHKGYFVLRDKAIECEVEIWELLKEQPRGSKDKFLDHNYRDKSSENERC